MIGAKGKGMWHITINEQCVGLLVVFLLFYTKNYEIQGSFNKIMIQFD